MKIISQIKKELCILPIIRKGFSRRMASSWYKACQRDYEKYKDRYAKSELKSIHKRGYLGGSIDKYDLLNNNDCKYITDFQYMYLQPFNSSFSKWIDDIYTTGKILKNNQDVLPHVYFSIVKRDGERQIYVPGINDRKYTAVDIISLLKDKKNLILRSSKWITSAKIYKLSYKNRGIYVNGKRFSTEQFEKLINDLGDEKVVIGDHLSYFTAKDGEKVVNEIRFYVSNDSGDNKILEADIYISKTGGHRIRMDIPSGTFIYHGKTGTYKYTVPNWATIVEKVESITESLFTLNYFAIDIVANNDDFSVVNFSKTPSLPSIPMSETLNAYLDGLYDKKTQGRNYKLKDILKQYKEIFVNRFYKKHSRKGIRLYMQKLWIETVKNDFKGTKLPLKTKVWAWKRGFTSFRTYQYGLTNENYKNILSDYDYYWLNRINNGYQKWINDKTTFRFAMEHFKNYIPSYYYLILKSQGKVVIRKMQDCPFPNLSPNDGLFEILKREKKLALKASAGTHGDGFYCMAYEKGKYLINGEAKTKKEILKMFETFKSFYIVTKWIHLNPELKKIYPHSVSTVRMMVINRHGYDPKILQTYIRIGSSKTGFTDNVGYGGICAMIDRDGEIYEPETLIDHVYYPCPVHPDTGTPIAGKIPYWEEACKLVTDISKSMPELEYLGYDVAITDNGPQILEINIHQDLHKCHRYAPEIREFFDDKIAQKKNKYHLS